MNILDLVRPHLLNIKPYSSARDEFEGDASVFIDANENPYGSVTGDPFNRYPDPHFRASRKKLAEIKNTGPENIFLSNGSDEAVDLLIRLFCEPKLDQIIISPPTFSMYEASAAINDVFISKVPLNESFQLQPDEILRKKEAKILFICSPNNPTGNQMKMEDIIFLLENFPNIIVVDEAYADFIGEKSMLDLINKYPHLLVMQTFSKAWGMAGLRVGMLFGHPEIIRMLCKIKMPYNINSYSQDQVLNALEKTTEKEEIVKRILKNKEYLHRHLIASRAILKVFPSDANFFLVHVANPHHLYDYLLHNGIIVRNVSKHIPGTLRITVGTEHENQLLVDKLSQYIPS